MKLVTNLVSILLFAVVVALAPMVVRDSLADQKAKSQFATIHHIMLGIFNVDAWKSQLSEIIISEIGKFDLKTTASKLRKTIESELSTVIDKLNEQIRESNKGSLTGKIKQVLIDLVVNVETIKKGVPKYADAIIEQMGSPENQKTIKEMAKKQIRKYIAQSYTDEDDEPVDQVLESTHSQTIEEASQKLEEGMAARKSDLEFGSYGVMGAAILLFAWAARPKHRTKLTVSLLFGTLLILLVIGVTIPMIDLEAKISEMSFVLLGHKVSFLNQILYFQSKSVINVFWLMITHHDFKMKVVGVLLITFSIFFPILKMGSSLIYYFSEKRRSSKIIQTLAFKIGKWSMADVMVIAILMGYIGFNGIVETQFNKMKAAVPKDVTFFTTNGTQLQMGYFIFITYVLLALVLSSYVHAAPPSASASTPGPAQKPEPV